MIYSIKTNSKINHIHKSAFRIVYKGNISSYEELLKKDKSFCVHQRNIQSFAIEPFTVKNNLSNKVIWDIFETRNLNDNLRLQTDFVRTRVNKLVENLNSFKKKARNWKPKGCHCRLRKQYAHGVGLFVEIILAYYY